MPGMLVICQLFTLTRIVWKTGSRGEIFWRKWKFLMVKSENEVRVFIGRFPNGWSWGNDTSWKKLPGEKAYAVLKNKEKWKEKDDREKQKKEKIKHCNSKSYFTKFLWTLYLVFWIHQATWSASIILWYPMVNLYLLYYIQAIRGRNRPRILIKIRKKQGI